MSKRATSFVLPSYGIEYSSAPYRSETSLFPSLKKWHLQLSGPRWCHASNASPLISGNAFDRIDQKRFQLCAVTTIPAIVCVCQWRLYTLISLCAGGNVESDIDIDNKNVGQAISGDETPSAGWSWYTRNETEKIANAVVQRALERFQCHSFLYSTGFA